MKWFKHDADAFLSEGVDILIDTEGFAGYGRWNRLLEIVAFKMDETDRCHAEYSIQKWCRLLGLKQKKLISFLELTEKQLKTKVVSSENIIRIEIPNLLKKRDNYSKNLQATKKPLTSIDIEVEVEVEVDKKKGKRKPSSIPSPKENLYDISFSEFWDIIPSRNGKKIDKPAAIKKFNKLKPDDLADIIVAVKHYAESKDIRDGIGIKDPHRFISNKDNSEYWKQWIEAEVQEEQEDESGMSSMDKFMANQKRREDLNK